MNHSEIAGIIYSGKEQRLRRFFLINLRTIRINSIQKKIMFISAGAGIGFAYYYFIGCTTGSCPISSNPYIATMYGAVSGFILSINSKKGTKESDTNNQKY
jgi:hypothetical protein